MDKSLVSMSSAVGHVHPRCPGADLLNYIIDQGKP